MSLNTSYETWALPMSDNVHWPYSCQSSRAIGVDYSSMPMLYDVICSEAAGKKLKAIRTGIGRLLGRIFCWILQRHCVRKVDGV